MRTSLRIAVSAFFIATLVVATGRFAPAKAPVADAAAHRANVTLQQWYHQYGEAGTHEAVLRFAKEYEQKTGVKVQVTWVLGQGQYDPKLNTALLGSNPPDVYEGSPSVARVKAGQVTPLDDLFSPQVKKDFDPHALAENTINGHIYAVKMLVDTGVIYYRKSLFKKAGITHPPTTFAELLVDAKKLTKGGVKGLFIGNDGGISIGDGPLPWSAGVEFLNKKGDKVTFDNARTVKAWEALRTLNKAGVLLLGAPIDWWDPSAFTQGLAAMQWCGLWAMPGVRKGVGNDFGVVAWPALDGQGKPATFWGGWSEMVNGHSKHIKEAKAFVKWLWIQNTKAQIEWNTAYGFHVPPRKSAIATANKLETGQARDAVAILRKYSHNTPPTWDAAMQTALDDAVAKVIKTNQSIPQLVHSAAKKAQAELNRELK